MVITGISNMKKALLVGLALLAYLLANNAMAAIDVAIDRNPVRLNESFQLTFQADSNPGDPDFSGLRQYFEILNQSQSNSISIVNGDYQRSVQWVLQVMPKQVGNFIIPAIPFGNEKTKPFEVTVNPPDQAATGVQDGMIFELAADKPSVYVQGQVVVTLRLMIDRNISGYQMDDLKIKNLDVVIEPLGDVKQYQTRVADKSYLVLEKQFALFPQQSGLLEIEPVIAEVQISRRAMSLSDVFPGSADIQRIRSQGLSIDVLTIPGAANAPYWLPATRLTLTEDWSDTTQLSAGEPVTRTITLAAEGLTAAQLPELTQTAVDGIKLYPDKPLLQDKKTSAGITGIRQQKIALIPTAAGIYHLPEMTVPWWNVVTAKQELARIPARAIEVKAGQNLAADKGITQPLAAEAATGAAQPPIAQVESNRFWVWLSVVLAVGWAVSLLIWWRGRRKTTNSKRITSDNAATISQRAAMQRLAQSCASNNAKDTRDALLTWANSLEQNISFNNLNQVARHFGDQLGIQIDALNQSLYGGNAKQWKGEELLRCCESITSFKKADHVNNKTSLCALNP